MKYEGCVPSNIYIYIMYYNVMSSWQWCFFSKLSPLPASQTVPRSLRTWRFQGIQWSDSSTADAAMRTGKVAIAFVGKKNEFKCEYCLGMRHPHGIWWFGIYTPGSSAGDLFGMVKWPLQRLSDLQLGDKKVTAWITWHLPWFECLISRFLL